MLLTRFYHNRSVATSPEGSWSAKTWSAKARTSESWTISVDIAARNGCFALGEVVARHVHDVLPVDVYNRMDERNFALCEGVMEPVCRRADDRLPDALVASAAVTMSMVMVMHMSPHGKHLLSFLITCMRTGAGWTLVTSRSCFAHWRSGNTCRRRETAGRRQS